MLQSPQVWVRLNAEIFSSNESNDAASGREMVSVGCGPPLLQLHAELHSRWFWLDAGGPFCPPLRSALSFV